MMLAQVNIPDVVDMPTGMQLLMANIAGVVAVAAAGYLAYAVIRQGLNWVLDREEARIRGRMEDAAANCDLLGLAEWGDHYEMVFGEEARAEFDEELNRKYQLWRK
jgi:hypothetical protein